MIGPTPFDWFKPDDSFQTAKFVRSHRQPHYEPRGMTNS